MARAEADQRVVAVLRRRNGTESEPVRFGRRHERREHVVFAFEHPVAHLILLRQSFVSVTTGRKVRTEGRAICK